MNDDVNADPRLLTMLNWLGDEWGPLGVLRVARAMWPSAALTLGIATQADNAPKPDKPEEPTGLGAVVEDAEGARWVRVNSDYAIDTHHWRRAGAAVNLRPWEIVDAVRVLSYGHTEGGPR